MTPEHLDRAYREAVTRATNELFVDERETEATNKEADERQEETR
jgi:hypothetical protein